MFNIYVMSYIKQNKKYNQTFESAQEIIFKCHYYVPEQG